MSVGELVLKEIVRLANAAVIDRQSGLARDLARVGDRVRDWRAVRRSVRLSASGHRRGAARQLWLGVTCRPSIGQYPCITAKMYAVLTPNSSIPSTASRAPITCQCRSSVSPDAPRVLIESREKSKASLGESRAPSQKYAAAQIPHSIPCTRANSSPIPPIIQIRIAIRFDTSRPSLSNRTRIFISVKANITTAAAWIAIVNTISDKPQSQLGWSNIVIRRAPQKSFTAGQTGFPDPGLRLAHSGYDAPLLTIEPPASAAPARQQVEQAALPCLSQRPCHLRFPLFLSADRSAICPVFSPSAGLPGSV